MHLADTVNRTRALLRALGELGAESASIARVAPTFACLLLEDAMSTAALLADAVEIHGDCVVSALVEAAATENDHLDQVCRARVELVGLHLAMEYSGVSHARRRAGNLGQAISETGRNGNPAIGVRVEDVQVTIAARLSATEVAATKDEQS